MDDDWRTRPTYIYILLRPDGIRKLGWAVNVRKRRMLWQRQMGMPLTIEAVWQFSGDTAAGNVEATAHRALKLHRVKGHSCVELYNQTLQEVCAAVDQALEQLDYPGVRIEVPLPKKSAGGRKVVHTDAKIRAVAHLPPAKAAAKLKPPMTIAGYQKRLERMRTNPDGT